MRMPFGEYRGVEVEELPIDYLEWLRDNVPLRDRLRAEVCGEIDARSRCYERDARHDNGRGRQENWRQGPRQSSNNVAIEIPRDDISLAREMLDRGYRASAQAHNPDVGVDQQSMARLNALIQLLRSQLQAVGGVQ